MKRNNDNMNRICCLRARSCFVISRTGVWLSSLAFSTNSNKFCWHDQILTNIKTNLPEVTVLHSISTLGPFFCPRSWPMWYQMKLIYQESFFFFSYGTSFQALPHMIHQITFMRCKTFNMELAPPYTITHLDQLFNKFVIKQADSLYYEM